MKVPWNRGGLRTYLTVLALALARPDSAAIWWALPLLLLGVALHVYAKGCLRQNQVVSMGGPYRFVRHPFYTANLLIDVSIALMSGCWPLIAFLPLWWLLVYVPVMREEEAYLTKLFPEVYPAYQRGLPRLIPFRRPWPAGGEPFSWCNRNIVADTVFPRALKLLALPLLFLIWRQIRGHGLGVLVQDPGAGLWEISLLATLYGISWALKRHLRDGKRVLPGALSAGWRRLLPALLLLAVAGAVHRPEVESSISLPIAAGAALAATLFLRRRSAQAQLVAEAVALAAILVLCELPWLMPAPILLYAPRLLDQRLARKSGAEQPGGAPRQPRLTAIAPYLCIVALGVITAVVKEIA